MAFPLNPAQREAVRRIDAPMLVLAGAGSGKTRVITAKIAHLVAQGVKPAHVVAITFTNKAAREMRERAQGLVGTRAARQLVICTFHALGVRMLRRDGERIGLKPNYSILDSDDVLGVLRDAGGTTDGPTTWGPVSVRLRVNGVVRLEQDVPLADLVNGTHLRIEPRLGTAATNIQLEVTNRTPRYLLLRDAKLIESPRGA